MKKLLFSLAAIFCSLTSFASDDVAVISGSLSELNAAEPVNVYVEWDYSNATLEEKPVDTYLQSRGAEWVRDYPDELKQAESEFNKYLTKKGKKFFNVVDSKSEAQYIITVKMGDFNYGSAALSVVIGFGSGDAHLKGDVNITKADGTRVAALKAMGVPGSAYGSTDRRIDSYKRLAGWIIKLTKKAK